MEALHLFNRAAKTTCVVAFGIGLSSSASAKEQPVDKARVPSAVITAVSTKYPAGTMTQFAREEERGKTVFEVTVVLGKKRREIEVATDGKILGEERILPFERTPPKVREAFARSKYGTGKVLRAEEATKYLPAPKVTYELLIDVGGRRLELLYDPNGKLVGREPGEED